MVRVVVLCLPVLLLFLVVLFGRFVVVAVVYFCRVRAVLCFGFCLFCLPGRPFYAIFY